MWFYGQQIDELYIYFCMKFDVLYMPDADYMSITIVRVRSGQEEYTCTIHS